MILNAISSGAGTTAPANINGTSLLNSLTRQNAPAFTAPRVIHEPLDVRAARNERGAGLPWYCTEGLIDSRRILERMPPPCLPKPAKVVSEEPKPDGAAKICIQRTVTKWGTELRFNNVIVPCDPPPKKGWCNLG